MSFERTSASSDYDGRSRLGKGVFVRESHRSFDATILFATRPEAETFAAQFPRFVKVVVFGVNTFTRIAGKYENYSLVGVGLQIKLKPDAVNQGVNETGRKRIDAFLKRCTELGVSVTREE